jgi:hypothetical protein
MLQFLLGYIQMEYIEEMSLPGWNQDGNKELLLWMEWASAEHIVKVHFILIYGHVIIICSHFIIFYMM